MERHRARGMELIFPKKFLLPQNYFGILPGLGRETVGARANTLNSRWSQSKRTGAHGFRQPRRKLLTRACVNSKSLTTCSAFLLMRRWNCAELGKQGIRAASSYLCRRYAHAWRSLWRACSARWRSTLSISELFQTPLVWTLLIFEATGSNVPRL